jgi:DNA-3-methyladenine glycosylase I
VSDAVPVRCAWPGLQDPMYAHYHDTEWGVPHRDDQRLFEKLILEGFQAGLSWLTILKKRETFRDAFHGFHAEKIARYSASDIARLMADPGIIRNRLKIEGAIHSARAYLALQERSTLSTFIWEHVPNGPIINRFESHLEVPTRTDISSRLSKNLKREGFRFVGPTSMYALMQSLGMVNDHLTACHRHDPCTRLQRTFANST